MECPACHKIQTEESSECQFCGIVFEKWYVKMGIKPIENEIKEEPQTTSNSENIVKPADHSALFVPTERSVLDTSSDDILAFRVDSQIRTLFGLLFFFVDPTVRFIHHFISPKVPFSLYTAIAIISILMGIYIGMIAKKRGYSDVLTAGGSGFLGGILRSLALYLLVPGTLIDKFSAALPVFGIYSVCAFIGGITAWILRKFLDIKL